MPCALSCLSEVKYLNLAFIESRFYNIMRFRFFTLNSNACACSYLSKAYIKDKVDSMFFEKLRLFSCLSRVDSIKAKYICHVLAFR